MQPFKIGLAAHQWVTDFSLGPGKLPQFIPFNHLNRIMIEKEASSSEVLSSQKNGPSVKADK